ncbi:alpha/beta fold hydrolase [Dokdonella sp.]|uniref:YheT family hydrolase n=1 Tax=Dokdonella sp. TaxID=2291710 RepID=UPI0025C30717|nr:alpha/beta fold hydrolase [Dokdonella sp.]
MPSTPATRVAQDAAQFRPPRWLRNPHVQTVLASAGLRRWLLREARRRVEGAAQKLPIDCGAGVCLQGFVTRQQALPVARGLCVLIHGWEGSAQSTYLIDAAAHLLAAGCDVVRINLRDHGGTQHLNRGLFHSCRIDEVVGAVRALAAQFAGQPLLVLGFSLGGNFALRVGLRAADVLSGVLAVCPVVSPAAGLFGLEQGPWFYQRYFLHKWRRSLRGKRQAFPDVEWFARADLKLDLRGLTRALVLRHTDFGSLEAYLDGYSIAGDRLAQLRVPATILAAADDPIIPIADFRALRLPEQVELAITAYGGHCGFLAGMLAPSFFEGFVRARLPRLLGEA